MTAFQIGEKVVYPNQGVGTIENISTRSFGDQFERFYLLRLRYASLTVMVPFSHVAEIGLRRITRTGEITRMLAYLGGEDFLLRSDWKERFKENSEKMRHGSLLEIAEVFKSLLALNRDKPLSFREKKMLDRARHMLLTEVSTARGCSETDSAALLQRALDKAHLVLPAAI